MVRLSHPSLPNVHAYSLAARCPQQYMKEMIDSKLTGDNEPRNDLFSNLVSASGMEKGDEGQLSDTELIGNIYGFLLAGHEVSCRSFLLWVEGQTDLVDVLDDGARTRFRLRRSCIISGRAA